MIMRSIRGARPPRFAYTWKDDKTLQVDYTSNRGLVDFAVGLARGVGRYFGEDLVVSKLSDSGFQVIFSSPQR
ncbi:MAG: heme NO-binding domain-containing protein [Deltaproteobacteria bacterium]|nr:heme NO-binding domain-containing protein [Deltaproteobacteria bacterium]